MRRLPTNPLVVLLSIWGAVACSSSEAPTTALSLAPMYSWAATQFGTTVALSPIFAQRVDTAFLGAGDTLTLHNREGGVLRVEVFVAS